MAKKTLANQSLSQIQMLQTAVKQSDQYTSATITEDIDTSSLDSDAQSRIKTVPDDMLIDDPDNREIYGDLEVEELAEAMRREGFFGLILAYPFEKKYRIESGHRRRYAAKAAGIKNLIIFVTDPPKTNYERIRRLHRPNLHGRKYPPSRLARIATSLYDNYVEESKQKSNDKTSENSIDKEKDNFNKLVASDLEISVQSVYFYKALFKCIPELQELADKGYSYSAISSASRLSTEKQTFIADKITERSLLKPGTVTRPYINELIEKVKLDKELIDVKDNIKSEERVRRVNAHKAITKSIDKLAEVLAQEKMFYKEEDIPAIISSLESIQESINKKLNELNGN